MREVKAAHERATKLSMLKLIEVIHSANPSALQRKWMAELMPQSMESPFDRLMRQARERAAAQR